MNMNLSTLNFDESATVISKGMHDIGMQIMIVKETLYTVTKQDAVKVLRKTTLFVELGKLHGPNVGQ